MTQSNVQIGQGYRQATMKPKVTVESIGTIPVDYGIRPTYEALNGEWFDRADALLKTRRPELRPERSGMPVSGVANVRFGWIHIDGESTDDEALLQIKQVRGLPATDLELMYFARLMRHATLSGQIREQMQRLSLVALGSSFRGPRAALYHAVITPNGPVQYLDMDKSSRLFTWNRMNAFLFCQIMPSGEPFRR